MHDIILTVKNLAKVYTNKSQKVHALRSINLEVRRGEILGLLGVNGAGKTTLSSILATLHPPTKGQVLYNGTSIYDDVIGYRYALGYCAQRSNLDDDLTVEQNLLFAGRYFLLDQSRVRQRVKTLLRDFSLDKYASFSVNELSGGYKQRVMIARALVHEPHILILDEPTVALDPGIRHQLWDTIKQLRDKGVTIILTTHYLDEAEMLSDRVCILHKGTILLIDKPENLKSSYKKANLEQVFLELTKEQSAA